MYRNGTTGELHGPVEAVTASRRQALVATEFRAATGLPGWFDWTKDFRLHLSLLGSSGLDSSGLKLPAASPEFAGGAGTEFNFTSFDRRMNFASFAPIFFVTGNTAQPLQSNPYED